MKKAPLTKKRERKIARKLTEMISTLANCLQH